MTSTSSRIYYVNLVLAGLVLGLHVLILWAAPFQSVYPVVRVIVVLGTFFVIFFVCARLVLTKRSVASINRPGSSFTLARVFQDRRLQAFLVFISLIGLFLHVWAKYYLTELWPINCLSAIRFAWLGVDRQVLPLYIKVFSVLGHLLTSFAYFGIMIASFNIGRSGSVGLINRHDLILQLFFVIVGVIYAGFIGSRNAMLAFLLMGLAGVILAVTLFEKSKVNGSQWRIFLLGLFLPVITAFIFSSFIFSDRLFCSLPEALTKSGGASVSAVKVVEFHLAGTYKEFDLIPRQRENQSNWRETLFIDKCSICGNFMVYLDHGIFNLSKIMASEARGDHILLKFFRSLPERLGLTVASVAGKYHNRVYGPGGTSLAGAAYHDFGFVGVVITAAVLGALFGISILMMQAYGVGALIGLLLFSCLFYIILISNLFVGFSVMPFPFIAFGVGWGLFVWLVINHLYPMKRDESPLRTHSAENETHA